MRPEHTVRSARRRTRWVTRLNPLALVVYWADWFESRGVYVPGEDNRSLSAMRDFGWLIAAWLFTVAALVLLFAFAI